MEFSNFETTEEIIRYCNEMGLEAEVTIEDSELYFREGDKVWKDTVKDCTVIRFK